MSEVKLYAERDLMGLDRSGNHYCKHVLAMTREGLHAKSDIAAELAFRDFELAALREELARSRKGNGDLVDRLTATEQRNAELINFLKALWHVVPNGYKSQIDDLVKTTESGARE